MTEDALERLKYPVGRAVIPEVVAPELFDGMIGILETFPAKLRAATAHLSPEQLDTPIAPAGGQFARLSTTAPTATSTPTSASRSR